MQIINEPSETHLIKARQWCLLYTGEPYVYNEDDLFFVKGDDCLGYAEYKLCAEMIHISWFCAPHSGAVCFQALLEFLQQRYIRAKSFKLGLSVWYDKGESPKAIGARLNLYYAFGFKIVGSTWFDYVKGVNFKMERSLHD